MPENGRSSRRTCIWSRRANPALNSGLGNLLERDCVHAIAEAAGCWTIGEDVAEVGIARITDGFDSFQEARAVESIRDDVRGNRLRKGGPACTGLKFLRGVEEDGVAAQASIDSRLEQAAHPRTKGALGPGLSSDVGTPRRLTVAATRRQPFRLCDLGADCRFWLVPGCPGHLSILIDHLLVRWKAASGWSRSRVLCGILVGAEGFEPSTSWSRTRRSTRLSHAPNVLSIPSVAPTLALAYHRYRER